MCVRSSVGGSTRTLSSFIPKMLADLYLAALKIWADAVEPSFTQQAGYYTTTRAPAIYLIYFHDVVPVFFADVLWALLSSLVAYMTWQNLKTAVIPEQLGHVPPGHDFVPHLCGCCDDMHICCMGWWCPCALRAKTTHQAKLQGWNYWCVVLILAFGWILPYGVSWVVVSGTCFVLRTELRKRANLPPNTCCDCILSFCCFGLTTCQEAQYVKRALAASAGAQVVGSPIQIVAYPTAPGTYPIAADPNQAFLQVRPQ